MLSWCDLVNLQLITISQKWWKTVSVQFTGFEHLILHLLAVLGGYRERLEWGVMIRECRSKWKGASFFGPGSRPVAIEGRCISGRARLFWAAQLNVVERPAVAVNQMVYCKRNGGGISRKEGEIGWLLIQTDEGVGTERARVLDFHLWGTPDPTPARGSCSERSQNSFPLSSPAGMLSDSSPLWYGHRASTKILLRLSPTPNSSMPRFIWNEYAI